MIPRFRFSLLFLFLLSIAPVSRGAITVNGIADEDVETDSASFDVPSEAGFSIVATLNEASLSLDTTVEVTTPGYYELVVSKTDESDGSEESVRIQFIVRDSSRRKFGVGSRRLGALSHHRFCRTGLRKWANSK